MIMLPPQKKCTPDDLMEFQAQHPDLPMELVSGQIVITPFQDFESSEVGVNFLSELSSYVKPRKLGRITSANAGFQLPNGDVRCVDGAFVPYHKLPTSPKGWAEVVPDLIAVVQSSTHTPELVMEKINTFLSMGTKIAVLIKPEEQELEIHRADQPVEIVPSNDVCYMDDLFPDWRLRVSHLWSVDFVRDGKST